MKFGGKSLKYFGRKKEAFWEGRKECQTRFAGKDREEEPLGSAVVLFCILIV